MTWPLMDWRRQVSLMQGGCASDGETPGQPPGHTKRVVAIDLGVEEDSRNDQEWQILGGCNDNVEEITTHMLQVI